MIHYIHVDSSKRDSTQYPYGNSYTIHLTTPIRNVQGIELVSAIIPNTLFTFTSGSFRYNGVLCNTIPSGFYTPQQLADVIHTLTELMVVFLPQELKFVFSAHASFEITEVTGDLVHLLGNLGGTAQSSVGTPYQYDRFYIKSSTPCTLIQNEYIFLDIEEIRTPSFIGTQKNVVTDTIEVGFDTIRNKKIYVANNAPYHTMFHSFAPVPMNVLPGHYKNFNEKTDFIVGAHTYIPRLDRLTVRWCDSEGNLISFNGVECHAFVLRIHSIAPAHLHQRSHPL